MRLEGLRLLGLLFLLTVIIGCGPPKVDPERVRQLIEDAENGDPISQRLMGEAYADGRISGIPKDATKALHWWERSAAQGNTEAMIRLARSYYHGKPGPKDFRKAETWLKKAAEAGSAEGQLELGKLYASGKLGQKDLQEALRWITLSVEQGHPAAKAVLGLYLQTGNGVPED
jgi:uncharacterized protein